MSARRFLIAGALLAALALPASAGAAQIVAGPTPYAYQNPEVEIDPGEEVTFLNLDLLPPHDVTSTDVGTNARPLFASPTVGFLAEVPVTGAEKLRPGRYEFLCSVHTFMVGSITVRGKAGNGGDAKGPRLKVKPLERRLTKIDDAGKLRFRVHLGEPARVRVRATAANGAKVAGGKVKLDRGRETIAAKLTPKGERLVATARRLILTVNVRATGRKGASEREFELTLF